MRLNTILHPTDYSEMSQAALRYAIDLARVHGSRVVVVHVAESLGPENVTFGEVRNQRQPDSYHKRLWDELHKKVAPAPGVPLDYRLVEGDPEVEILRVAAECHCDLIVLASHGRRGFQRLMQGSVAEHVLRAALCPVLVVKGPASTLPVPEEGAQSLPVASPSLK